MQTQRTPWRRWLRALHRDIGYLAIGLTIVYALSGIAINHIEDWDPNFTQIDGDFQLDPDLLARLSIDPSEPASLEKSAQIILKGLRREPFFDEAFALDAEHLDITLPSSTLYVDLRSGGVREEGQRPRALLRAANWLHLNRGKRAWTWIADGYALFLLFLALSGLFMLPIRRGLLDRRVFLAFLGAAVPVIYVSLSAGP